MSKFTAYYNLCPINDPKEFLGLSNDCEEGNVIITLGRNIVRIIKLSTQNQIRSWTTQDKLSLKVIFDKKSEQYVGVFNNRYIRCWDEKTTDINKTKKIKFHKDIHEIVSNSSLDEVLIIYQDGNCESLSSAIQSRKNEDNNSSAVIDTQNQLIENPDIFILRNGKKILTYFLKNTKDSTVELVTTSLSEDNLKSMESNKYKLTRQNVSLSGYVVVNGPSFPSLLTIWSDKRIFMMSLKENVSSDNVPGNFVSMLNIFKLDHLVSIVSISVNCIAIYGANDVQEGASLILYNTQFKVIKARQFFKIFFDFSRLWVAENHILLAMGQNLSIVTYRVTKESLSELVGSQISSNFNSTEIAYDFINEEDNVEGAIDLAPSQPDEIINKFKLRTESNLSKTSEKNKNLIVADGKSIPFIPYENFENDFHTICNSNNLEIEIVSTDHVDKDDIKLELMKNYNDAGFVTKNIDMLAKALEKIGASEQEITEKLIDILINTDNTDDMIACLRKYTCVSERALAKILKYALTNFIPKAIEENDEKYIAKSETNVMDKKFELLNIIISCSLNVENFSLYIRKELDFNHIIILIKHLYNLFISEENLLEERPETSIDFDEDYVILKWFSLIISTHFQQLALSRDLELLNSLTKWLDIICSHKQNLDEICKLSYKLYQLIDGKSNLKNKAYSKWYSIEEVKLY